MKHFTQLIEKLDSTTSTNRKVNLLTNYFRSVDSATAVWVLFFLLGKRLKRSISSRLLMKIATESLDLPRWLISESLSAVGDSSEAISLLLELQPQEKRDELPFYHWIILLIKFQSRRQ